MESNFLYLSLCFHFASVIAITKTSNCSSKLCQTHSELKTFIEDLFIHQQSTLNEQQQKIEDYQQQIRNFSDTQSSMKEKLLTLVPFMSKLEEMNDLQQTLQTCNDSQAVLVKKLGKMKIEFSFKQGVINNLTSLLEHQLDENVNYHESKKQEYLKYRQSILEKLEAIETRLSVDPQEQPQDQIKRKELLTQVCRSKNGYTYEPKLNICYKVFGFPAFTNASDLLNECGNDGAELMKVDSQPVQDYLAGELGKLMVEYDYALIQGTDRANEGQWVYENGKPLTYFNWNVGQPDEASDQNIIGINPRENFKWHDLTSQIPAIFIYICQV